jgi:hypothetical protein
MSRLHEIEQRHVQLVELKALLEDMPDDPLARPLLESRVSDLQQELAEIERAPVRIPEAELTFAGKPVLGSIGIDAKFAGSVLADFQDMVSNHHSAARHGGIGSRGPRHAEGESRLFLTALPRGSFGLLLTQPHVSDFVAAAQVAEALDQLAALIESAASGDAAFGETVQNFHPRVLVPLERFLANLKSQEVSFRLRAGTRQVALAAEQVRGAHLRIQAAQPETEEETIAGVFRGVLLESWKFDFVPDDRLPISGKLSEDLTEEDAKAMLAIVNKRSRARLNATRIRTQGGLGRPSYELREIKRLTE